jgi:hypothetical protein
MKTYKTFTRTWWRNNPAWPNGLEPCAGRRYTHATRLSEQEAQEMCKRWNATHKPGRLSRKMEYTEE